MSDIAWTIFSTVSLISSGLMFYITLTTKEVKKYNQNFLLLTIILFSFSIYGFLHLPEKTSLVTILKEGFETIGYIGLLIFGIKFLELEDKWR